LQKVLPLEISASEVKRKLEASDPLALIDVREHSEHAICRIDGAELIPMLIIPQHLPALRERAAQSQLVFYCHHGVRSLQVVNWLRRQGIASCQSLSGGIERWSLEVDPQVPRY
jgi:rhodanese-related sulfurtransferase